MSQANAKLRQLLLQRAPSFRTAPVAAAAFKMPFTTFTDGHKSGKQADPSVSASPLPGKAGCGNPTYDPTVASILDLRGIGHWLALLLGVPAANRAVTQQPTNVTGVTVNYADQACVAGNGALTFVAAAHTLSWEAQGDSGPGVAVDVSAGGYFTLASGTAGKALHVTVDAAALSVTDKSDADIAVSALLTCHVFPFDLVERPSALLELGYTDIGAYNRLVTARVNTLKFDVVAEKQDISLGLIAGLMQEAASSWDATPTAYDSIRACGKGGSVWNGVDGALGVIVAGNVELNNNMKGEMAAQAENLPLDQVGGYTHTTQGEIGASGELTLVFDNGGAWRKALDGVSTRMRLASRGVNGGNVFGLYMDFPAVDFDPQSVDENNSGLRAKVKWQAHRVSSGVLPLITLVNDVAFY